MISYVSGDLFESPAQTLVNTVNTVGVMGKGIALTFKKVFPDMFREYQQLCESKQLQVGSLFLFHSDTKLVLNFPTKKHWRNPSKLEYIEAGLQTFVRMYERAGIYSVAFPPLGCGNGELDFDLVRQVMERYLAPLPIQVYIYAPLKRSGPAEHRSPEEIASWLRENPAELAFDEVWADLVAAFRQRREVETLSRGGRFEAHAADQGEAMRIWAPGRTTKVAREEFWDLWKQFREFGILTAASVPAHRENIASYLLAIFHVLSYVRVVPLADSYQEFQANPTRGLQLVPVAKREAAQREMMLV